MDWHLYYWVWLAIAGGITFILYGLALAGGFLGGWVGMSVFRHKTRKGFFWFVLAVSTAIHAVVYWGLGIGG